jgi:hypothetical protein
MATTRASGYVVTAAVWNAVLSRLTDDGVTFSGAVNGSTGAFSSTLAVTGAATLSSTLGVTGFTTLSGNVGVGTAVNAARINASIGGATADASNYGKGIQITGPAATTGQMMSLVRQGTRIWSMGLGYNDNALVFGDGQATDSNFTATNGSLVIRDGGQVQAPKQPGFLAHNSANDSVGTIGDVTVSFDTESYDDGAVFASNTFTAPIAGRYLLCASVYVTNAEGASRNVAVRFAQSGSGHYYFGNGTLAATSGLAQFSGAVVLTLAASEQCSVILTPGGAGTPNLTIGSTSGGAPLTWFSGRLLP